MVYFLTILLFIVFTFGLLNRISEKVPKGINTWDQSFSYFITLLGGEYQQMFGENPSPDDMKGIKWMLYFMSSMVMNVVALNLLIAVISETYGKVQDTYEAVECK